MIIHDTYNVTKDLYFEQLFSFSKLSMNTEFIKEF